MSLEWVVIALTWASVGLGVLAIYYSVRTRDARIRQLERTLEVTEQILTRKETELRLMRDMVTRPNPPHFPQERHDGA